MMDAYFGTKELYQVVLKANTSMIFGSRKVEKGEPIMYFEKVSIANLTERSSPIMARGGWGNMPHVIWEDRSEMTFTLSEGVMSSVGLGILTSSRMLEHKKGNGTLYLPKVEGPFELENKSFYLQREPALEKPTFCYEYNNDTIQKRVSFSLNGKKLTVENGEPGKVYLLDYYFKYGDEALIYLIEKERFNGTFSLEAKFYTKDENEGLNTTNIMFMPKIRIVSDINLRLGERADPTVSVFNIIAMPERTVDSDKMLMKIVRLGEDIDGDI